MKSDKRYVTADELQQLIRRKPGLAYYACPSYLQDSALEFQDLTLLNNLNYEIISCNTPYLKDQFEVALSTGMDYEKAFRSIYGHLIQKCTAFFIRAESDGTITGLRLKEIALAKEAKIPILELPREFEERRRENEFFNSEIS